MALAAAQVAALAWFAPSPMGLPLDDAWIHQVVARTFATSGTLGFAPGQHGAAATSYLWALALALNFKTVNVSPVAWAFALNAVATVATGQLLYTLFLRGRPRRVTEGAWRLALLLATATACTQGHLLWFAWSGMEASGFLALSLGAIVLVTTPRPSPRSMLYAGVCAGLCAAIRPEAMALGGILGIYAHRRTQQRSAAFWVAAPWIFAVALYVGTNLAKTGHAMPSTLGGRRWLWFGPMEGMTNDQLVVELLVEWGRRLYSFTFAKLVAVVFAALGLAAYGTVRLLWVASDGPRLAWFWAFCHTAFYVVLLPSAGHGGRYQPFVPLLLVFSAAMGAAFVFWDVAAALRAEKLRVLAPVAVAGCAAIVWSSNGSFRDADDAAVRHIETTEIGMGEVVNELPPEAVVASFDIGGIAWASKRPVLDLGGLSDPDTALLIQQGRAHEILAKNHVTHVILPAPYESDSFDVIEFASRLSLRENDALELEPIRVRDTPLEEWLLGTQATWNAAPRQVLYAVTYTGRPPPRTMSALRPEARRPIQDPAGTIRTRERAVVEHQLAVLQQWGVNVDIAVTETPPKDEPPPPQTCRVALGIWGTATEGCEAVGPASVVSSALAERLEPYIDLFDMTGAAREVPLVLARVKRASDPGFYPILAPNMAAAASRATSAEHHSGWGIPVAVVVFFGALVITALARSRAAAAGIAAAIVGCSPPLDLVRAAAEGPGAVGAALAAGADVAARGAGGATALHVAAARGDAESVAQLLARGADADAKDESGATPVHAAARRGLAHPLALLLRTSRDVDAVAGPLARTALHDAALAAEPSAVRALLLAGADPMRGDSRDKTPLHLVAASDSFRAASIIPILLDEASDTTQTDSRGFTPLHAAAYADNAIAIELLAGSSEIEATTPSGETALDVALRHHRDRAAEALLRAGAIPHAMPPLHDAARMDDVARAAVAIGAGADTERLYEGRTALEIARANGSKRVEALLARLR